jgi:hypothetical protein
MAKDFYRICKQRLKITCSRLSVACPVSIVVQVQQVINDVHQAVDIAGHAREIIVALSFGEWTCQIIEQVFGIALDRRHRGTNLMGCDRQGPTLLGSVLGAARWTFRAPEFDAEYADPASSSF